MLNNRDIVCFANDWQNDPMSKKHIVRRLARHNRILWVESLGNRRPRAEVRDVGRMGRKLTRFALDLASAELRRPEPNIYLLTPIALPAYGWPLAERINSAVVGTTVRRAMTRLGFRRPITYTFVPASAWVVGNLGEDRIVYHCVDDFAAFAGANPSIEEYEKALCQRSNAVIACSLPLFESRRIWNPRTILVRHGVEHAHFAKALDPHLEIPADLAALPRPRIGFFGLIAEWIDLALLRAVAQALPSVQVVLLGTAQRSLDALEGLPNVHYLGHRPYDSLPAYCKGFDVAVLPFAASPLARAANPLKLREYLAAGLPVVATDIPEARALVPHLRVAASTPTFISELESALETPGPNLDRSSAMASETWDAKAAEIAQILSGEDGQVNISSRGLGHDLRA